MGSQACKFVLRLGSTMVLARLLTPADYGLIAMVTTITAFVTMFKDMGLSMATVQKEDINHDQISTLFWINVAFSVAIMILVAGIAPCIAWFYGETRLTGITLALAGVFIFSGLTVQHEALLKRQMRFSALAGIEITSILVGCLAGIVSAWLGAGYWALVVMQLAYGIITAAGVWVLCGWRPRLPVRNSGVRSMLAFGGNLSGFNILNYFARNLDHVLIGRFCGTQQLGLYAKAYQLLLLPIQQVNYPIASVAIPTLSRLQDDPERYRRYYCKAMNMIAYLTAPLIVFMAAMSDEIIAIVLGNQWVGASIIFKVLAIAALVQSFGHSTGWVYISLGQTGRMMQWGLISCPIYVLSFVIGLQWGALGVAVSYTACTYLLILPAFLFAFKYSHVNLSHLIQATWRPIVISLIMGFIMIFARSHIPESHPVLVLSLSCLIGVSVLAVSILIWAGVKEEALNLCKVIKELKAG